MPITYLTGDLSTIDHDPEQTSYICLLTDKDASTFPKELKTSSPDLYKVFSMFRSNYKNSNLVGNVKSLNIHTNQVTICVIFCLEKNKKSEKVLANLNLLFDALKRLQEEVCDIYIYEGFFEEYLFAFEYFEAEIEIDFKKSESNFIIINTDKAKLNKKIKDNE